MADGPTDAPAPAHPGRGGRTSPRRGRAPFYGWRIVAALAVSQTVGYGVLAYSFGVILTPMRTDLRLPVTTATGAITVSALVTAAAAVPVGRWVDRHGGRVLMTGGSIAATLLIAAWSQVHDALQLYLVFAGIGVASAMVLYETAFAVVVTWFHARRGTALLAITVVAGFASTIFMPLAGRLTDQYGWRTAVLILAVVHGAATIPLHALIRRPAELGLHPDGAAAPPPAPAGGHRDRAQILRAARTDPFFWTIGLALVAHALTTTVMAVHLVGYLITAGHPATWAATVTGLLGVLSVTGRLVTTAVSRRLRLTTIAALIFTVQAAASLALPAAGPSRAGAVVCVLGVGIGFGVVSIIKPALLAGQYGLPAYATLTGALAAPVTLAKAVAPSAAAALLAATGSYRQVFIACALALAISAAATAAAGRHYHPEMP